MKNELKKLGQKVWITLILLSPSFVTLATASTHVTTTSSLSSFKGIEISVSVTLVLLSIIVLSSKAPARFDQ